MEKLYKDYRNGNEKRQPMTIESALRGVRHWAENYISGLTENNPEMIKKWQKVIDMKINQLRIDDPH